MNPNVILGITGGSGAVYTVRLMNVLLASGYEVHTTISRSGYEVLKQELGIDVDLDDFQPGLMTLAGTPFETEDRQRSVWEGKPGGAASQRVVRLEGRAAGSVHYYRYDDYMAPIASGTFRNAGMVICPCSGATVSAVAHASSQNLVHRAADVQLKEKRKLIVVPREAPMSTIQLRNMVLCAEAGAVVLPASPGWYHGVTSVMDLVDFVVSRICDQLGVDNHLINRWGE